MPLLQSNRFRSIKAVPPNERIIAGYSIEMLDNGIRELSARQVNTPWEAAQLAALRKERRLRCAAPENKPSEKAAA